MITPFSWTGWKNKQCRFSFLMQFSYYSVNFQWLFWKFLKWFAAFVCVGFFVSLCSFFVWLFLSVVENTLSMKSKGNTRFFSIWNKLDMWLTFLYRKILKALFWRLLAFLSVASHLLKPYTNRRSSSIVLCSLLLFIVLMELGIAAYLYHCLKPTRFPHSHRKKHFISFRYRSCLCS